MRYLNWRFTYLHIFTHLLTYYGGLRTLSDTVACIQVESVTANSVSSVAASCVASVPNATFLCAFTVNILLWIIEPFNDEEHQRDSGRIPRRERIRMFPHTTSTHHVIIAQRDVTMTSRSIRCVRVCGWSLRLVRDGRDRKTLHGASRASHGWSGIAVAAIELSSDASAAALSPVRTFVGRRSVSVPARNRLWWVAVTVISSIQLEWTACCDCSLSVHWRQLWSARLALTSSFFVGLFQWLTIKKHPQ